MTDEISESERQELNRQVITMLVEKASERLGTPSEKNWRGVQLYHDRGTATALTPIGTVECYVYTTDRHNVKQRHTRATFYLDGKRISRVALAELLSA